MSRANDLVEPLVMGDEAAMLDLFSYLRDNEPIAYVDHRSYEPFWVLTRHEDVKFISQNNDLFLNNPRTVILPLAFEEKMLETFGTRNGVESLVQMDNPKHKQFRNVTREWFKPGPVSKLTPMIEAIAKEFVDKMEAMGGECDFVKDIAMLYPLRVIMSILGVAPEEEGMMLTLTQELFGGSDVDQVRGGEVDETGQAGLETLLEFFNYFKGVVEKRKAEPADDLATVLANALIEGEPMGELDQISYFIITATAGHDTTAASVSGGMKALIDFPEQLQQLKAQPDLAADAAKEMIRWVSPVRHFMRTPTEDVEFHGQTIKAGEHLAIWYPAANRDERAFDNPNQFDITRDNRNQMAFGFGGHMCLGQHLAVLELEIFFRELLSRLDWIELAEPPKGVEAFFVGGLKTMPVRYAFK